MPLYDFTKNKHDIIIQAGQSNSNGTAFGHIDSPYQQKNEVMQMTDGFIISIASENIRENSIVSH